MDDHAKNLENELKTVAETCRMDIGAIRGNRPSVELVENIEVSAYGQTLPIKQLGSIGLVPPRGLAITAWDKDAVPAIMKAIEAARIGLTVSSDGLTVRASLSQLGDERRAELMKVAKKTAEEARIQVRNRRDDAMKRIKADTTISEDQQFKMRERAQKFVDEANKKIEEILDRKIQELGE